MKKTFISIKTIISQHRWKVMIALVLLVLGGWWFFSQKQSQEEQLQTITPEYRTLIKTLDLTGVVDAKNKVRLRFLAGGKIVYLGVREGDWVKQWQTIASVDARDLQKRLEKSLNQYMQQRWDWEDVLDESKDQALDTSEHRYVDQQQWDLENSVIDVEIQDIAISQSVMSAPFAGILVYSPVTTAYTQVIATDYFELIDPQSLIFKAEVNEEDISLIKLGQTANIVLDAYQAEELPTQLDYIAYQSTQTASGTVFLVEFPLVKDSQAEQLTQSEAGKELLSKFRLGMNGDVQIILEKKEDVLSLPLITTIQRDDQVFVEILTNDGEIETREIQIGLETDEYVEVLSGLKPETDQVILPQN
jgi:RND family efflux transporter MFP subunit